MNHKRVLSILKLAIVSLSLTGFTGQSWAGGLTAIASFNGSNGANPSYGGVTLDRQGNLFGTTFGGGANGVGTVWEIASGTDTINTLASFNSANGTNPQTGVIVDAQGNLYGVTASGGANSAGTVFEIAKWSGTISTLASFDGTDGSAPRFLTMDAAGNLYGATAAGGANTDGTVFEVVKGSGTITTLATFSGSTGNNPLGGVTLDAQGNLYGTTRSGGANNEGTVFEILNGSGTITTLASFNGSDGRNPRNGVALDAQGNLYGTTGVAGSPATVWEITKGSGTITILATFGNNTLSAVTLDGQGNLYGNTNAAGANGDGSIWEIANGSGTITTLASFDGTHGANPFAGLTLDSNGNLYGTANSGGDNGVGTVFVLTRAVVPEPAGVLLLGLGVLISAGYNWTRRSR